MCPALSALKPLETASATTAQDAGVQRQGAAADVPSSVVNVAWQSARLCEPVDFCFRCDGLMVCSPHGHCGDCVLPH